MRNPDAGDAVGNGDARQASAAMECVIPDAGDAVGNGDRSSGCAVIECAVPMLVTLSGIMNCTSLTVRSQVTQMRMNA